MGLTITYWVGSGEDGLARDTINITYSSYTKACESSKFSSLSTLAKEGQYRTVSYKEVLVALEELNISTDFMDVDSDVYSLFWFMLNMKSYEQETPSENIFFDAIC